MWPLLLHLSGQLNEVCEPHEEAQVGVIVEFLVAPITQ